MDCKVNDYKATRYTRAAAALYFSLKDSYISLQTNITLRKLFLSQKKVLNKI